MVNGGVGKANAYFYWWNGLEHYHFLFLVFWGLIKTIWFIRGALFYKLKITWWPNFIEPFGALILFLLFIFPLFSNATLITIHEYLEYGISMRFDSVSSGIWINIILIWIRYFTVSNKVWADFLYTIIYIFQIIILSAVK